MILIGKRGISPLIATVLIIGFTIALAAIIITWGVSFVTQQTVQTGEETAATLDLVQNAGVKVIAVKFNNFVADGADSFNITIENTGSIDLDGFLIRAFDDNGEVYTNLTEFAGGLGAFGIRTIRELKFEGTNQLDNAQSGDLIPEFRGELAQFMKVNWRAT